MCDREGLAHSHPRARGPFSLGRWATKFCVLFIPKTSRRLIRAQLLDPLSTNSLQWAQFENRDPTIGAVCGEVVYATISAIACLGGAKLPRGDDGGQSAGP